MTITLTRHQIISYIKSIIRIVGYVMLANLPHADYPLSTLRDACGLLIGAELLGILEEVGQAYGS